MKKAYLGIRLRRLREERGLTQASLARALGVSASYYNQMEHNQRPLTVPVLIKLNQAFGLDLEQFADGDDARLIVDLRAALSDQGSRLSALEVRELAINMPDVARTMVAMHQRLREVTERADVLAAWLGGEPTVASPPTAFEAVRDYFYNRRNYVAVLDEAAETIGESFSQGGLGEGLATRLAGRHGVRLAFDADGQTLRAFDAAERILHLGGRLTRGQRAFQMATQLAFLEQGDAIDRLAGETDLPDDARKLLRIGLANYFAGALILPYGSFLAAAEADGYDIALLARRFGVGIETICHRLSTLQRPSAPGVPFFFVRVDRAGNISKRQSATDFHFSRVGGSCPLWNVYEAFSRPGEVLTQVAEMPDGRLYLWIAHMIRPGLGGYGAPQKTFAVALGCDLSHADRLIYGRGLEGRQGATPIGPGCKLCERRNCPQRAFPMVGKPLDSNRDHTSFAPYAD